MNLLVFRSFLCLFVLASSFIGGAKGDEGAVEGISSNESESLGQRLRGLVGTAVRRVLVGECLSKEVWVETREFGVEFNYEFILASEELLVLGLRSGSGLSELSLKWIPYLDVILNPGFGLDVISTIISKGDLFCDPADNHAFALYLECAAGFNKHIAPIIVILKNTAGMNDNKYGKDFFSPLFPSESVEAVEGEEDALRRLIVASANYQCGRQTLFEKYLPYLAKFTKTTLFDKRDALIDLEALIGSDDDTKAALSCFEDFEHY
mmetsp:Transcript_4688/g.8698  ORF Transcript_4688/g.8698 Transcript_4688/m.8698 type:complete len:265 (-) Transcript_4688:151-945(-)